jgi:mannan endo-1,4-beta-mannosidase
MKNRNFLCVVGFICLLLFTHCSISAKEPLSEPDISGNGSQQGEKPGLRVKDRYLYTAGNEKVILKGFNAMIVYWDIHGDINFPEIEKTGANCCRIFWNLGNPTPKPEDLDQVLGNCVRNKMIPIICLWDATGKWDNLQKCADYWCTPEITPILKKYEKTLIVNIANEPGNKAMGNDLFTTTYARLVKQLRDAGIRTPLMIDADKWGRNADSVLDTGDSLLVKDPEHNLIFSWHLWDPAHYGSGTTSEIERIINKAASKKICFIVGEFGPCEQTKNCTGTAINWEALIELAFKNDIGYLPWVWRWTDSHSCIDYNKAHYGDWVNPPWGESVSVTHPYSIKNTAVRPKSLTNY